MKGLTILGRDDVPAALAGDHAYTHLISIQGLDRPLECFVAGFKEFTGPKLALVFDDISKPWQGYVPPGITEVNAILDFAREMDAVEMNLLVHCEAGISRSTATAFIILCFLLGPGQEQEAFRRVLEAQPRARPNSLMVELADWRLGREGRMIEATLRKWSS